jgi:hypothetical protein
MGSSYPGLDLANPGQIPGILKGVDHPGVGTTTNYDQL